MGNIPISIPTKRYIAAYIKKTLGDKPHMNNDHWIGQFFIALLDHSANERRSEFPKKHYDAHVKVFISHYVHSKRGCNIHETNIKYFNRFLEMQIKKSLREDIEFHLQQNGVLYQAVEAARDNLGLDEEDMKTDMIVKDFYRWREEMGKPMLKTGPKHIEHSFSKIVGDVMNQVSMIDQLNSSMMQSGLKLF